LPHPSLQNGLRKCPFVLSSPRYNINERVSTSYGSGWVRSFDPVHDIYRVELDWRPLDVQIAEYKEEDNVSVSSSISSASTAFGGAVPPADISVVKSETSNILLETVVEGEGEGEGGRGARSETTKCQQRCWRLEPRKLGLLYKT